MSGGVVALREQVQCGRTVLLDIVGMSHEKSGCDECSDVFTPTSILALAVACAGGAAEAATFVAPTSRRFAQVGCVVGGRSTWAS